jgi:enterochelin esterase-like enzyme
MGRFVGRATVVASYSFGRGCLILAALLLSGALIVFGQEPRIELRYPLRPDSFRHEGVPRGKVSRHEWRESRVYPGTVRRYYVYLPAQYDAKEPAALMVFQDGHTYIKEDGDFRVPVVFDNLIHKREMPVTIGVLAV